MLKGSGWYVTDFKEQQKSPEKKDGDKLKNKNAKPENKKNLLIIRMKNKFSLFLLIISFNHVNISSKN